MVEPVLYYTLALIQTKIIEKLNKKGPDAFSLENRKYDSAEKPRLFEMRLPLLQTKAFQE